jgi:hypothetical protein
MLPYKGFKVSSPSSKIKKFYGTRTDKVIEIIEIDGIRSWDKMRKALDFSIRELNYHLHVLYDEGILSRNEMKYYLDTDFVTAYKNAFRRT